MIGLSNVLHRSGMDVEVLLLSDGGMNGYECNAPMTTIKGDFIWNLIFVLPIRIWRLDRQDVVISSQFYVNVWIAFLKKIRLTPVKSIARESTRIFVRFSGWRRISAKIGVRSFYECHNLVIAQTIDMQNDLLQINRKIFTKVLLNPIDLAATSPNLKHADWSSKLTIMAAGRLVPIKQFNILIEAFLELDKSYHLVIFGEGPERQRLLDLAEKLQIADRFWLPGEVEEPRQFFGMAQACVVSSLLEGFPNVLLEMMCENGAVVSTLCADGIADLPGVVKCNPNDVTALRQALKAALSFSDLEREANKIQMLEHLKSRTFQKYWENIVTYAG
jgi:glycosyltransferase involved in cell wall biosynthesis